MLDLMLDSVDEDGEFIRMRDMVRDYATIYVMAKRRHKGCDGMGELAMAKEEFRDSLWMLAEYCKRKGYLSADIHFEIDSVAEELVD